MTCGELWCSTITLWPSICRVSGGCVEGEWNVSTNNSLFVGCQMQ